MNPTNLLGICRILDSANKSIRINDAVAARNYASFSLFLSVLIVRVLIILNVKCKLILGVRLKQVYKFNQAETNI